MEYEDRGGGRVVIILFPAWSATSLLEVQSYSSHLFSLYTECLKLYGITGRRSSLYRVTIIEKAANEDHIFM